MQGVAYVVIQDCPVCLTCIDDTRSNSADIYCVECPRCGNFNITEEATNILHNDVLKDLQIANASGWIRENQGIEISFEDIENLKNIKTPTVAEKANKLLLYLSKTYPKPGQAIPYDINMANPREEHLSLLSITWAQDLNEFAYLFHVYLLQENLFLIRDSENNIVISSGGWAYIDSLRQINPESQLAFVAMWFDDKLKPLWTEAIEPGIEASGYKPLLMSEHHHNNRIDDEIIVMIRRSKFIVADFTCQRQNVYFEVGLALGMGLPVIWLCRKDELKEKNVHFDIRQYPFIDWEDSKLEDVKRAIQIKIESIFGRGNYKRSSV